MPPAAILSAAVALAVFALTQLILGLRSFGQLRADFGALKVGLEANLGSITGSVQELKADVHAMRDGLGRVLELQARLAVLEREVERLRNEFERRRSD